MWGLPSILGSRGMTWPFGTVDLWHVCPPTKWGELFSARQNQPSAIYVRLQRYHEISITIKRTGGYKFMKFQEAQQTPTCSKFWLPTLFRPTEAGCFFFVRVLLETNRSIVKAWSAWKIEPVRMFIPSTIVTEKLTIDLKTWTFDDIQVILERVCGYRLSCCPRNTPAPLQGSYCTVIMPHACRWQVQHRFQPGSLHCRCQQVSTSTIKIIIWI